MRQLILVLLSIALTVLSWGSYGPLLKTGTIEMGGSHLLPFIFVGVSYFLIAVVAAAGILVWRGEPGQWTVAGTVWSLLAGAVTAIGALGVILALTNQGSPIYVMPLIFGCAPAVNTILAMLMSRTYREAGPFFYAGLILVVAGAVAVLVFNPAGARATAITVPQLIKVLAFVAVTAACWGSYGPLLHKGQMLMHGSRMRPFICVGLSYFAIAVVAPLILRLAIGDHGEITISGTLWSLAGGAAGAFGSLGVLLAFTFGGKPIYVMPLVFGGAPVINTFISILSAGDVGRINPLFYAGLIVVVAGAVSVLIFAPRSKPHAAGPTGAAAPAKA